MDKLQGSWIWYELLSPDPEGSRAFYEHVVGWTMTTSHEGDASYGFIARADGGMTGGMLRLSQEMQDHGARPCWLGYVGVDDCDAAIAAIEAAGGKCLMGPRDVETAGRFALVADCCGAPFYVMTPSSAPGQGGSTAFAALPRVGSCGWNELYSDHPGKALGFYTGLFGWTLPDAMDMGALGKYQFIAHDGTMIGAIMQRPDPVPTPVWAHYFWVESIAAAKTRIEAAGGHAVNGPSEVPGPLWVIQGLDPQGALFSLVGGK